MGFIEEALIVAVVLATPLVLASLGELVAERSGVLNLGIEGMLLVGAATGALTAVNTGSLFYAFMAGTVAGAAMGSIHACFAVSLHANQIVAGLTLGVFGIGVSSFVGQSVAGVPVAERLSGIQIPVLSSVPVVGQAFFNQDLVVYFAVVMLVATALFLQRTRAGAAIRACGSAPAAVDVAGLSVSTIRWAATVFGGAMAGFGGAYFSVAFARVWSDDLTAGRGWIALALVIFASWRPLALLPGAVLFGFLDATNFQLQSQGVAVSAHWLAMMPYVFTLAALFLLAVWRRKGRSAVPAALGVPYARESRV